MAAEGGEDPGTHRYATHVDWSEDIDIRHISRDLPILSSMQNGRIARLYLLFALQLKRNYRRFNIPRVVSNIHGN